MSVTENSDGARTHLPGPTDPSRDRDLDCLKGVAIVTVVLGHTAQSAAGPDFAQDLAFRIIYSFHMPMFMFVAGMTMSFGLLPSSRDMPHHVASYIFKRAGRLLLPFFAWGLIQFVRSGPAESVSAWLSGLLIEPDNGLWFLLALFEISVVVALSAWVARIILDRRKAVADPIATTIALAGCLAAGATMFWLSRYVVPGIGLAAYYVKYVCLGILFKRLYPLGLPAWVGAAALPVFAVLVPYWVWNGPPAVGWHPPFIDERIVTAVFDFIVASSGTLVTLAVARLISRYAPGLVVVAIAYCGRRTLDIYALHFYLMGFFPPVVAPIAMALIVSFVLRQVPLAAVVLFGDAKDRPLWWPAMLGLRDKSARVRP